MIDYKTKVSERQSTYDVIVERNGQIDKGWDQKNVGLVLDQYNGITLRYLGGSTCSYRNDPKEKRAMLVKAAAVILQTIDRIDDGSLSLVTPLDVQQRSEPSDTDRLAAAILEAGIGEPSQNEGAIDTAIRLIKEMGANAGAKVNNGRTE